MQEKKKGRPLYALLIEHREIPLLAVLVLLLILVSIRVPGYLADNYMNVLKGGSINMVMACGMLCVLLVGSIDISVTAILAFAGAVCGKLMGMGVIQSTWMMFALGILIGAVIGAVNGVCFGILLCWALQFAGPVIGCDTLAHTALAKALQAIDVLTLGASV